MIFSEKLAKEYICLKKQSPDLESPFIIGGFPKSGLDKYIGQLVRAGFSLAVAFQDENKERTIREQITLKTNGSI